MNSGFFIFLAGLAGAVLFALFDYFGFNIGLKRGWADFSLKNKYRTYQAAFQILLTAFLFFVFGWLSALVFLLLWWTWVCDLLFYLFCEIFNYGNDRGNFRKEVLSNSVQWAWWTPYGLLFTKKGNTIPYKILIIQSAAGIA
ncbi:MAG: hypothetical protein MUE56_08420, partial [Ignavibacteria bacterium]|nr:hypothetical protein [Ignavibacteria bacterium]